MDAFYFWTDMCKRIEIELYMAGLNALGNWVSYVTFWTLERTDEELKSAKMAGCAL